MKKLSLAYYRQRDTLALSQDLIGKFLVTNVHGKLTSGMIVETEAYLGVDDRACHAFNGRRTSRNAVMYLPGGYSYVYLCYGIHHLFNIVTHEEGHPHAILIRAIEPCEGIETMLERRGFPILKHTLTSGPGSMSQALGITTALSGEPLTGNLVWVEDRGLVIAKKDINATPRIGVAYAKEHALFPYRFRLKNNPWTSRAK